MNSPREFTQADVEAFANLEGEADDYEPDRPRSVLWGSELTVNWTIEEKAA